MTAKMPPVLGVNRWGFLVQYDAQGVRTAESSFNFFDTPGPDRFFEAVSGVLVGQTHYVWCLKGDYPGPYIPYFETFSLTLAHMGTIPITGDDVPDVNGTGNVEGNTLVTDGTFLYTLDTDRTKVHKIGLDGVVARTYALSPVGDTLGINLTMDNSTLLYSVTGGDL